MMFFQIVRFRRHMDYFPRVIVMPILVLIWLLNLSSVFLSAAEIHDAAKNGDLVKVKVLIAKDPTLIDAVDESGRTPLHWACRGVHIEIVKFLADRGGDVNAQDYSAVASLHSAASRGHLKTAKILIDQGAYPDMKMYEGVTPLHLAARNGHKEMAALLLAEGASFSLQNADEETPLHTAASEGKSKVIEVLADCIIAKDPAALNIIDFDGWTALHSACAKGHLDSVELLVSKGIDIDLRCTIGQTGYNLAKKEGFHEIAAFLSQEGADQSPQRFPRLTGPYLGQKPPGKTPQLFAKGIVSTKAGIYGTIVFSPDNDEVFWKPNTKELLFMKNVNGAWKAPQVFPFKEKDSINVPFFSYDGRRLYFMAGSRKPDGMIGNESIWYVEKRRDGWSKPRAFDSNVNSIPMHWQFSMDKKGNVYTSTDNIYCARFENGQYLAPEKLPAPINSVHTVKYRDGEIGPFISPEGDYLLYTKFPVGLFISFRNGDGSWSAPYNLSERFDSKGFDSAAKLTPDGKYLFFQSVRSGSNPNRSLYWVDAGIIEEFRREHTKEKSE
ncbi:MAG: ankyrin repeat domain-containing protein [Deltaproteobacteria bacterium]|nr:ankyrin repeat domain-containing protein [Deltaproteobacteria bacterium]